MLPTLHGLAHRFCVLLACVMFALYLPCEGSWLQRAERAALACEIAAQGMEKASIELDKAAEVQLFM